MKVQHILVPTDFSERSEAAIKVAGEFVDLFNCTVDLMHVIPLIRYFSESMDPLGVPFSLEKNIYPHCMKNSQNKLEELAEKYIKKEHKGQMITVIERKPSDAIATQATRGCYDLILMSSKGEHESIHILGGTTEKVIRHSSIPVLTVNDEIDPDGISTILVPVDFSDASFFSIIPAFDLAKEFKSKIVLLNIVELFTAGSDMGPYTPTTIDENPVYESLIAKLSEYFLDHAQYHLHVQRTGIPFQDVLISTAEQHEIAIDLETVVIRGISAQYDIADYANEHADFVVMNTHGRTGLARVFIGSTAEQVSRQIVKPLLIIRPQFFEEAVER